MDLLKPSSFIASSHVTLICFGSDVAFIFIFSTFAGTADKNKKCIVGYTALVLNLDTSTRYKVTTNHKSKLKTCLMLNEGRKTLIIKYRFLYSQSVKLQSNSLLSGVTDNRWAYSSNVDAKNACGNSPSVT